MSADMYSTNPTIVGGGLIAATAGIAGGTALPDAPTMIWPYVTVGLGFLFLGMAVGITGSMRSLTGLLRFCSQSIWRRRARLNAGK